MNKIHSLSNKLIDAHIKGKVISSSEYNFLKSIKEAYKFQDISEKLLKMKRIGWKIGATSLKAQQYLNTKEPVTAPIFKDYCYQSPSTITIFTKQNTSAECEFGFKFKKHLPPKAKKYDLNEIVSGDSIFCATGITHGDLVKGIEINDNNFISETLVTHKSSNLKKIIRQENRLDL